ncbi:single-stranded-DNA-specific exonuclease RecJ [Halorientalis regularis]|jgi:single-stranded-DNA-specific exonuclease|uniref:RecJ-like exonuclease n=1 Tax=Halorientalis regularis TaxID=660518 RepID=A0A1G7GKT9_9EURY|nr:DHH family phosphoesterase [Halorientalis regularis]SDE88788.1 RecJ-like exonuclease [Halorientalis regularis]
MAGPVQALEDRAVACANYLQSAERVVLASHIDADGLTSAGIAATALERAGIEFEVVFKKQLDDHEIATIAARDEETVLFTDFGSGQLDAIADHEAAGDFTPVVADHHQPAERDTEYHLNPLLEGLDGASELSGAGASYVLARALESEGVDNRDLARLAVVGAVGDMQAVGGELVGANREIVAEGVAAGVLEEGTDLAFYGKQTRPLPKLLEYASEVRIPGISNDQNGAIRFLDGLGLDLKRDGEWRRWVDLDHEERRTVASSLVQRALQKGVPADKVDGLVGTTYTLLAEPAGTELRDASEFSTLLNATARYERADVGLAVCLGDRADGLERARKLLRNHRRNLSEGLQWVKETGVTQEENLQWFDAGEEIRETIVGIVAGMAVGVDGVDRDRPIVAFARKNDEETKVSARGTGPLVARGLDLSAVMGEASAEVGGGGGGHDVAAGATVPAGREQEFVELADELVGEQLG